MDFWRGVIYEKSFIYIIYADPPPPFGGMGGLYRFKALNPNLLSFNRQHDAPYLAESVLKNFQFPLIVGRQVKTFGLVNRIPKHIER